MSRYVLVLVALVLAAPLAAADPPVPVPECVPVQGRIDPYCDTARYYVTRSYELGEENAAQAQERAEPIAEDAAALVAHALLVADSMRSAPLTIVVLASNMAVCTLDETVLACDASSGRVEQDGAFDLCAVAPASDAPEAVLLWAFSRAANGIVRSTTTYFLVGTPLEGETVCRDHWGTALALAGFGDSYLTRDPEAESAAAAADPAGYAVVEADGALCVGANVGCRAVSGRPGYEGELDVCGTTPPSTTHGLYTWATTRAANGIVRSFTYWLLDGTLLAGEAPCHDHRTTLDAAATLATLP